MQSKSRLFAFVSVTHSIDATELQREEDDNNGEELPANSSVLN